MLPFVSVIITTFRPETKRYLDECIKSVHNLDYPKDRLEVLLVAKESYRPEYEGIKTIYTKDDRHTAEGINYGIRHASPEAKYFFYINDDVILTKECLSHLVDCVGDNMLLANGISPCDNYLNYALMFAIPDADGFHQFNKRYYKYEELQPHFAALRDAKSLYRRGAVFVPWLCMYATLIPRKLTDTIGLFDENFKTGQCDMDFSYRAKMAGYKTVAILDAVIWHFGGRTSSHTLDNKTRAENIEYFKKKWGVLPDGIGEDELAELKA